MSGQVRIPIAIGAVKSLSDPSPRSDPPDPIPPTTVAQQRREQRDRYMHRDIQQQLSGSVRALLRQPIHLR